MIRGKVKKFEDNCSIIASSVRRISDASMVDIVMADKQSFAELHRLKDILNAHKQAKQLERDAKFAKRSNALKYFSSFYLSY